MAYSAVSIAGVKRNENRAVAFLQCAENKDINAKTAFEKLENARQRDLLSRCDHWVDGQHHNKYHHGFDGAGYRECYVFKVKVAGLHHRFYGFLIRPMPETKPRFQVCVIVSHAIKTTWETDPSELDGANRLRNTDEVVQAIKREFPEHGRGSHAVKRPLDYWKQ